MRKLDIPDLSNNAVLYIHRDKAGNMWFGTYDGLNLYNGKNTFVFRYDPGDEHSIDGNIIRKIIDGGPDHIWVSTIIGLNRISISERKVVKSYPQYPETCLLTSDSLGHALFMSSDNSISYFSPEKELFHDIHVPGLALTDVKELFFYQNNFYILTVSGLLREIELTVHEASVSLNFNETSLHTLEINHAFYDKEEEKLFFVDVTNKLYVYDSKSKQKELVANLSFLNGRYSDISRILLWESDIYISYINNGLIKLNGKSNTLEYTSVSIEAGVFSLCKDTIQNILWIGTDGQGINMYYKENKPFRVLPLEHLPNSSQKPVRGIYTDEKNTLWIATKGDGIFRIQDYHLYDDQPISEDRVTHYTTENGLANNQVFCFSRNTDKNTLWIGSEGLGLSYYSYRDDKIYTINSDIRWVHSICEINDSVLWLATAGDGLIEIVVNKSTTPFTLKSIRFLVFEMGGRICSNFHSMVFDGDSSLLVGIRGGYGAIRLNIYTNEYKSFSPDNQGNSAIGDVLCLYVDRDSIYYLGSSSGLVQVGENATRQFNRKNRIANDMIHGILKDNTDCLWLSTNRGLIKYNPENNLFHNFYHQDLTVTEFSDDAYWKCPHTGCLFFGGINGLVWLEPANKSSGKYIPDLRFLDVTMNGEVHSLTSATGELVIPPSVSSFTISFVAIDYIGGNNYEYAYLLDNYDTSWVALQKNNEVSFSNLPFGRYTLRTKYKDDVFDNVIKEYQLPIYIQPPWYLTYWAVGGYIILYILLLVSIIKFFHMRFAKRQQLLAQQMKDEQKEKLYEAKLNFFTNITHELRTPLTLINGIIENIHSFKVTESEEELYEENIEILRNNVKGLNELIREILDFRKIEESGFTELKIKRIDIAEFIKKQSELFLPSIEKDRINFRVEAPESVKPLILVIDDNRDIVWLIKNTLSVEYEIKEAFNASEALHFLETHIPVLIITDILMPGINGLDFIKQIKAAKLTKHIPIVIVSAEISAKEQAEGLNSGADLYLTKPFSAIVLHSAVNRLISTKRDLKEYYYSPESAYELYDGQLLHQEDKDFMELVTKIIKENLDKENFRPEMIAEKTGLNTRSFYRKFKRITSLSPTDYIKDYRFIYAAQLLITTNLSIQEIIYKVGINNKSYFYREFFKKYKMTPKEYRTREKMV
ncbi:MAG: response regulator [Tannerellaceae bacterium]|nr:response regulator [Tannerellaceae bacterium]